MSINAIFTLFVFLLVTSCSLEPKKNNTDVHVDLSQIIQTSQSGIQSTPFDFLKNDVGTRSIPTAGLAGFSCFGVNVIGPGIPISGINQGAPLNLGFIHQKVLSRQSYCTYRGVISPPIFASTAIQNISLQIPSGPARVVQVLGSYSASQCSSGFENNGPNTLDVYEVGRTVLDLFSDTSANIQSEWPTGASTAEQSDRLGRVADCFGCENFSLGGGLTNTTASWTNTPFTGIAQRVQFFSAGRMERVKIHAKTSGAGSYKAKIFTDAEISSNLAPTNPGSLGVTMGSFQALTTSFDDYTVQFPSGGTYITPGIYWLVLEFSGAGPFFFAGEGASPVNVKTFNAGVWATDVNLADMFFNILACP